MSITQRSLETLIDLVEIKLSCMEVFDRDDAREVANLEHCLDELRGLAGQRVPPREDTTVVRLAKTNVPRRVRTRAAAG